MRVRRTLKLGIGHETWFVDTRNEFLVEYPKCDHYRFSYSTQRNRFLVESKGPRHALALVRLPERSSIESVFQVFEREAEDSKIKPEFKPVTIFVGHGHSPQWRDLKDHLQDLHGMKVVAYDRGPRAGLSVKEVLESILDESSLALLVLTGEDLDANRQLHARENVVHEVGLFQGRLGFGRAIILLEEGVNEFSNILGINQIRFSKGNIRETFGDVVATVGREFDHEEG